MRYRIVSITQVYNEVRKANLARFLEHLRPLVDDMVFFDDASTDGSYEYLLAQRCRVLRGTRNNFRNEGAQRRTMLQHALELKPDFILWLDCDEVLTDGAAQRLQQVCDWCVKEKIDGVSMYELNLWRSGCWRRMDEQYDNGWFIRLWRVVPGMTIEVKPGLHQPAYPNTLQRVEKVEDPAVIHYGFADMRQLAFKYLSYRHHGQAGWALTRFLEEKSLKTRLVPAEQFPPSLRVQEPPPRPQPFRDNLLQVESHRDEVLRPGVSVVCLIYKSTQWLAYVYEQVLRHTPLKGHEFFFVANDPVDEVVQYLEDHYIPHVVWRNPVIEGEWYINRVYRAWNHGARTARGDYLLFINSDMGFTPGWMDQLLATVTHDNCICSRLVESGRMRSGTYGIERDFGRVAAQYDEKGFLEYAASVSQDEVKDGGLYMPLLIRRDKFLEVGGYPEGNIVPGSDLFQPRIARQGEPCVPGDHVLMRKLKSIGIHHQTCFSSIVYHFQEGEMRDQATGEAVQPPPLVAVLGVEQDATLAWLAGVLPRAVSLPLSAAGGGAAMPTSVKLLILPATGPDVTTTDHSVVRWVGGGDLPREEAMLNRLAAAHAVVTDEPEMMVRLPEQELQVVGARSRDEAAARQGWLTVLRQVMLMHDSARAQGSTPAELLVPRFRIARPRRSLRFWVGKLLGRGK